MSKLLISVIIPTFQHAKTLCSCIDSILKQDYSNIEIIVVNDGSIDDTLNILESYKEKIKIINQRNQGANPARNRGRVDAHGEYLIFCDADVVMREHMLSCLFEVLDNDPCASYAYCNFKFGWKTFGGVEFDAQKLRERNYIHTTSLVRAKDFPGFDNSLKRLQDWDVWLTMLEQGKSGVLVDKLLFKVKTEGASRIGSSWLPSIFYKIPWRRIGWIPERINKYEIAHAIIRKKHSL